MTRSNLSRELWLGKGNAQPGTLGRDFGRFGLDWWPALTRHDRHTGSRQKHLERLNTARNAIAHDDVAAIETLRREGFPLRMSTFRRWRCALDGLAGSMDSVLGAHLGRLFHKAPPW